jgi:hypothetical protein
VGYEFKSKKGKERMNNLTKIIVAFLFTLQMLPASAQSQAMTPESMLETIEIPGIQNPEVIPETVIPKADVPLDRQWRPVNRTLACHSLNYIKATLESRGQYIWGIGEKLPEYIPQDPFDGIIFFRSPITNEWTIVAVKKDILVGCIIIAGTKFTTVNELGVAPAWLEENETE